MFQLPQISDRSAAAPLRDVLLDMLKNDESIEVGAAEVERITTPVFQLLVSLRMQAEEDGKRVVIVDPSDVFKDAAKGLGLKKILNITE